MAQHESRPQEVQGVHTQNANNAASRQIQDELKKQLQQKDRVIEQLRAKDTGSKEENKAITKQKNDLRNQITDLQNALLLKDRELEGIKAKDKQLARLKREGAEKQKQMEALQKAIDGLKKEMFDYQAVQEQLKEKDVVAAKREQFANAQADEERKNLLRKESVAKATKVEMENSLRAEKAKVSKLEEERNRIQADRDEIDR